MDSGPIFWFRNVVRIVTESSNRYSFSFLPYLFVPDLTVLDQTIRPSDEGLDGDSTRRSLSLLQAKPPASGGARGAESSLAISHDQLRPITSMTGLRLSGPQARRGSAHRSLGWFQASDTNQQTVDRTAGEMCCRILPTRQHITVLRLCTSRNYYYAAIQSICNLSGHDADVSLCNNSTHSPTHCKLTLRHQHFFQIFRFRHLCLRVYKCDIQTSNWFLKYNKHFDSDKTLFL